MQFKILEAFCLDQFTANNPIASGDDGLYYLIQELISIIPCLSSRYSYFYNIELPYKDDYVVEQVNSTLLYGVAKCGNIVHRAYIIFAIYSLYYAWQYSQNQDSYNLSRAMIYLHIAQKEKQYFDNIIKKDRHKAKSGYKCNNDRVKEWVQYKVLAYVSQYYQQKSDIMDLPSYVLNYYSKLLKNITRKIFFTEHYLVVCKILQAESYGQSKSMHHTEKYYQTVINYYQVQNIMIKQHNTTVSNAKNYKPLIQHPCNLNTDNEQSGVYRGLNDLVAQYLDMIIHGLLPVNDDWYSCSSIIVQLSSGKFSNLKDELAKFETENSKDKFSVPDLVIN